MKGFRFTIAHLLALTLFAAIAIAALRASSDLWDSIVQSATLALLLLSVLLAVHRTERKRAFWLGFALFGWAYLAASLVPPIEERLATTKGLAYVDSLVPRRAGSLIIRLRHNNQAPGRIVVRTVATSNTTAQTGTSLGRSLVPHYLTGRLLAGSGGNSETFIRIGHLFTALVLAFLGGLLSRGLYAASTRREA